MCEKPLSVSFDTNAKPWSFIDQSGQLTGLDIELVMSILHHASCTLDIHTNIPWKRHLSWLEQGKIDIAAQASKTLAREQFAYFSHPYRHEYIAIYIRQLDRGKFKFISLADLSKQKFRLGIRRGNYYGEQFIQLLDNPQFKELLQTAETEQDNFVKLVAKRIDGFIGYPPGTEIDLQKANLSDQIIRHTMPIINTGDIHVMGTSNNCL